MPRIDFTAVGLVVLAFALAAVVIRLGQTAIHRLLDSLDDAENRAAVHVRAKQLTEALTIAAYGVAAVASVTLALSDFGIAGPRWDLRQLGRWAAAHGVNLIVIIVGAFVVIRVADLLIEHLQFKFGRRHADTDLEWQRRSTTVGVILRSLVTAAVGFVAGLMLLRELSINVLPILTGAGIAGLALGFGAQNLVRDVISGFFLILEDQVRIGDLTRINGVAGTVEQINLRTIVLRDPEGAVYAFPNGTITALANLSKQFSYAIVDLCVGYAEDIDRVTATIRDVGRSMEGDADWKSFLLDSIETAGVESLEGGVATIRARFKTLPLAQGKVAGELRKRLLAAMAGRGIRLTARTAVPQV